jgi:hypothetical protein
MVRIVQFQKTRFITNLPKFSKRIVLVDLGLILPYNAMILTLHFMKIISPPSNNPLPFYECILFSFMCLKFKIHLVNHITERGNTLIKPVPVQMHIDASF